jgi:NAD(P)H-dependent flavin oxidoreductase YrpB (nitropropane dioxygenase family)
MAGGLTTAALVGAAAEAGSFGFLPGGYRTATQLTDDLTAVRSRTTAFGVNLFVPDRTPVDRDAVSRYRDALADEVSALGADLGPERFEDDDGWDAKIDLLVREPVPWVSFTFGLPDATTVQRLRAAGSRLLMTVTAVDEARAAADLDPDGLVVQSADAGGHRGTFDQQRRPDADRLTDLVAAVAGAVGLPVVAAGGIADRDGVRRALDAGADAVAVGTALLLADEAGTGPVHRAAITEAGSRTTTTRAYTGRVARGLRTGFIDRFEHLAPAAYPAVHHLTAPMRRWAAEHGDREHLHLWAGTGFRSARPGPAGDLLTGLMP